METSTCAYNTAQVGWERWDKPLLGMHRLASTARFGERPYLQNWCGQAIKEDILMLTYGLHVHTRKLVSMPVHMHLHMHTIIQQQ